jgi:hypothetical protein
MLTENQVIELRESLNNKGYCQVNNILSSDLIEFLKISSYITELSSHTENNNDPSKVVSTKNKHSQMVYSSPIGETLLIYFTSLYSQISGKDLIPTYSFFRKYFKTNDLKKHKDRPSCQYSATIQIDSSEDKSWPIFIEDKDNNEIKCNSKLGSIVFYKGEEVNHWREKLEFEYSSHLFLHWVDRADPRYLPFHLDGRKTLGIPK